jgi:hypothetical protein
MNQKTIFVTLCILFLILNGCSRNTGHSSSPATDEFSYVPPEHWVMRDVPGFKYQFAFGQRKHDFTPNINVVDVNSPLTLADFVTGNLQAMKQMSQKESRPLKVFSQSEFTTDSKQSAVKVVTETEYKGQPLRQTFYFFEAGNDKKFVVTCTVLVEDGQSYEQIFDSSLRTFKTS